MTQKVWGLLVATALLSTLASCQSKKEERPCDGDESRCHAVPQEKKESARVEEQSAPSTESAIQEERGEEQALHQAPSEPQQVESQESLSLESTTPPSAVVEVESQASLGSPDVRQEEAIAPSRVKAENPLQEGERAESAPSS